MYNLKIIEMESGVDTAIAIGWCGEQIAEAKLLI